MSPSTTRDSSQSRVESELEKGNVTSQNAAVSSSLISRHLNAEINPAGVDVLVLLCWFTTGFLDSTIFNAYRTFVSMQTGNTIFIALGAAPATTNRPYSWLKSLSSLLTFTLGAFFFSRLAKFLSPHRRSTFLLSFAIQTAFLGLAAILVQACVVESRLEFLGEDIEWVHLVPIMLLSFQAPAQTCMTRQVDLYEVPTVVVTTMVYDFASDERLFVGIKKNAKRNRRFGGFVCMLIGAILGGWVTVWTGNIGVTLWSAAGIKAGITGAWMAWPAKRVSGEVIEGV